MFFVYLIKSIDNNWFYVGLTQNIEQRLLDHNRGKTKSTKHMKPFELVYTKEFESRVEAREYEKYLKVRSKKELLLRELGYL